MIRFPDRLLLKYYLYAGTRSHGFVIPVTVEYMLDSGLSFTEVATAQAAFMAIWTLGEVPTGYVSDYIGRRNALVASKVLIVLALLTLGFGRTFAAFVAGYGIWSLGVTFRSGAGSAWLYDALEERLDGDEYTRVRGRGATVQLSVTAVASIAGGWLGAVNWLYPFLANTVLVALGLPVLMTFVTLGPDADATVSSSRGILSVVRDFFARPPLRTFVVYMALFFALEQVVQTFVQPVSTDLGIPVAALGWLYAGFSLVAAGANYIASSVRNHIGEETWLIGAPLGLAMLLLLTPFVPLLAIPVFLVLRATSSLTATLRGQYLNDHIETTGRATVLSAASMVFALAAMVSRQVGGIVADMTSPLTMFGLFSGAFVVASMVLLRSSFPTARDPAIETAGD
jgi:MFS family permease